MNAKKVIKKCIGPSMKSLIFFAVGLLIILLDVDMDSFGAIGMLFIMIGFFRLITNELIMLAGAARSIKNLQKEGMLELAAQELQSGIKTVYGKNKTIVTENFVFVRNGGVALNCNRIIYIYKNTQVIRFLIIPILRVESLMACTPSVSAAAYTKIGKDKQDVISDIAGRLINFNPNMMVGYTSENIKLYREKVKEYKKAQKEQKNRV